MRASKAWARTWPSARREPLLVSTRNPRALPSDSSIRCDYPGCTECARFEVVVMFSDSATFSRVVCSTYREHPVRIALVTADAAQVTP